MSHASHWVFTWNDEWADVTDDPVHLWDASTMAYIVYQLERADTGQLHLQGFVSLIKKQRLSWLRKHISADAHFEISRGRPDQAAAYCKKEDTRVLGPWEYGAIPDARGKKSQTALAVESIQAGTPLADIAAEFPLAWVRSHRGLCSLSAALSRPKAVWREVTAIVLWGPTRSGKTRMAMESRCADGRNPFAMPLSEGFWFDGYDGEDTLVIDDFYGQIKFSSMLRIIDGHYLQVPVKGGFTWSRWTKVFITSNTHPDDWWKGSRDSIPLASIEALYARFHEIKLIS